MFNPLVYLSIVVLLFQDDDNGDSAKGVASQFSCGLLSGLYETLVSRWYGYMITKVFSDTLEKQPVEFHVYCAGESRNLKPIQKTHNHSKGNFNTPNLHYSLDYLFK